MTTHRSAPPVPATTGPVPRAERALAPDLARGAMLLLIALANSAGVFLASAPGADPDPRGAERVDNLLMFLFVHARAFPVFAIMFGYGLVQLARRQDAVTGDPRVTRAILLRRNAWLVVFGLVHAVLLYSGDFLGAYGIVGIVFTLLLLRRGDRTYTVPLWYVGFGAVYTLVVAALALTGILSGPSGEPIPLPQDAFGSVTAPDYLSSLLARAEEWPTHTLTVLPFILMVWLGAWAARRRVLEEPARHRRLLTVGLLGGMSVGVLGGLPMALVSAGLLDVDAATGPWIKLLYETTGFFGGIGYVCLFGLLALWLTGRRRGAVTTAITALGQRSLSGYLFQSVAWLVLAAPFALDLGAASGSPTFTAAVAAVAVWLVSVLVAGFMQSRSHRGPAEILLRRLTYRR